MSPEPGHMDEHHRHPWAMMDAQAAAGAYALHLHATQQITPPDQLNATTTTSPDSIKNEVKLEPGVDFVNTSTASSTPPSSTPTTSSADHYQQWMSYSMAYQQPYSQHGHHHHPHHQPQIEVAQHHAIGFA